MSNILEGEVQTKYKVGQRVNTAFGEATIVGIGYAGEHIAYDLDNNHWAYQAQIYAPAPGAKTLYKHGLVLGVCPYCGEDLKLDEIERSGDDLIEAWTCSDNPAHWGNRVYTLSGVNGTSSGDCFELNDLVIKP